jgi:hypothetical protein
MATATFEFDCLQGLELTVELYAPGDDTLVYSEEAAEYTNDLGAYSVALVDVPSGTYRVRVCQADDTTLGRGLLLHTNEAGVERAGETLAAVPDALAVPADIQQVKGDADAATAMKALYGGAVLRGKITGITSSLELATNLAETAADAYAGNVMVFTTGSLTGQARRITAYSAGTVTLYIAFAEVPSIDDEFLILGYIE